MGISFLVNGEAVDVTAPPDVTLLDWLREARGLTGTKEGCNEGDCGACTVILDRPDGRRDAVNACIQLLPMLDGCSVTTVEGVAGPDGPHPAQAAMVDLHGSQCGFCTPGFVCSMVAAHGTETAMTDVLAGNLCRCTGYGPILAAGEAMRGAAEPAWMAPLRDEMAALPRCEALDAAGRRAHLPRTVDQLASVREAEPDARIVAGATDVGLWITKGLQEPHALIFTGHVAGFDRIEMANGVLRLGAGATYAQAHRPLGDLHPDLGELVRRIGSTQVRNAGTVGGNVANGSPIGDMPPALIALGATLVLRKGAARRRLAMEDFFVAYGEQDLRPGEFLEAIEIPAPAQGDILSLHKVSKRFDQDITAVLGCFRVRVEAGRITAARLAYGGMAATPKRAGAAEQALIGAPWTPDAIEAAQAALAQDFTPITDMRASADYRMWVARNLLLRMFLEHQGAPTRLAGTPC